MAQSHKYEHQTHETIEWVFEENLLTIASWLVPVERDF